MTYFQMGVAVQANPANGVREERAVEAIYICG